MSKLLFPLAVMAVAVAAFPAASVATPSVGGMAVGAKTGQSKTLTGRVWVLTALLGKSPLRGTELTSEFTTTARVSGSSGCNRYSATYKVSGTTIRVSSPVASTRMACRLAVELQEAAFVKALRSARRYSVNGTKLTLTPAGGRAILTYKAQSQALAGTSWTVLSYNNGKEAVVSVLGGTRLTALFGQDGNLTGFAGCNDYNAPYKGTAPKISIGPVASTRKNCAEPEGVMDQELRYLAALETAATYRIEGSRMEMRTSGGALADFQRR